MSRKRRSILLVDDHEQTVTNLRLVLARRLDAEILTANGGAEGIRITREEKPDLILLDLDMPVVSGHDVLEQLKREEIKTRVIVMTGYREIETVVRCIRAGACDYLAKPVEADLIVQHIERALVLESAYNLVVAHAPASIQQLLNRVDQQSLDAKVEAAKIAEAEQTARETWEHKFSFFTRVAYTVMTVATVWTMHGLGVVDSTGGVLVFFLLFMLLLLLPIERVRELFLSARTSKVSLKVDPP